MRAWYVKIELDIGLYDSVVVASLEYLDELVAAGVQPSKICLSSEIGNGSEIYQVWVDEAAEITDEACMDIIERMNKET